MSRISLTRKPLTVVRRACVTEVNSNVENPDFIYMMKLLISLDMHTTHESRHIGIEEWKVHNWKLKFYYCYFPIITIIMYYKYQLISKCKSMFEENMIL